MNLTYLVDDKTPEGNRLKVFGVTVDGLVSDLDGKIQEGNRTAFDNVVGGIPLSTGRTLYVPHDSKVGDNIHRLHHR
jgi:hypothetical protein